MRKPTQQCPRSALATGESDTDGETLGSIQGLEVEEGGALKVKGEEETGVLRQVWGTDAAERKGEDVGPAGTMGPAEQRRTGGTTE
ncbi:hypothetical protein NDU88_005269 [Pleurodeles waltl]|uniref:Uncharacterized protein n=1 Tax=Pleurodeles waltl TaxID=8319 RepID=A0AAV7N003_PLEWA|nr:hypothetical protein NDU88_005269 [Pleurodeles waltl]